MSADESDVKHSIMVVYHRDQAVSVALDIEDHAVAIDDARGGIALLQLVGRTPVGLPRLMEPGLQRLFSVGVLRPELHERFTCNDSQGFSG